MRRALLEHLQHGLQHANDPAVWTVFTFGEAAQPVKMAEQLVRAVNEMNDHAALSAMAAPRRADALSYRARVGSSPSPIRRNRPHLVPKCPRRSPSAAPASTT